MPPFGWECIWNWLNHHQALLGGMVLLSVAAFFGTLIVVPVLVVQLPRDYLKTEKAATRSRYGIWWWPIQVVKNLVGWAVILAGLVMLVLPGQGLLTIFIGLSLVNFPGKPLLLRKLVQNKRVMRAVNWLRKKCHRPPLDLPDWQTGAKP